MKKASQFMTIVLGGCVICALSAVQAGASQKNEICGVYITCVKNEANRYSILLQEHAAAFQGRLDAQQDGTVQAPPRPVFAALCAKEMLTCEQAVMPAGFVPDHVFEPSDDDYVQD